MNAERFKYYDFAYGKPAQHHLAASLCRCFAWALNDEQISGTGAQFWERLHEDILWFHTPVTAELRYIEILRSDWEAAEPIKCSFI